MYKPLEMTPEMEASAIEARRAYKRAWYAKNKERMAEYNKQYWARRGQELAAAMEAEKRAKEATKKTSKSKRG